MASEFIVSRGLSDSESGKYLRLMNNASRRLMIINELWLMRQGVSLDQYSFKFEPVNLAVVAKKSYEKMRHLYGYTNSIDNIHVSSEVVPAISDRHILSVALDAISDVIIQTSVSKDPAEIRVVRRNTQVHLEILDRGPVVTSKDISNVFTNKAQSTKEISNFLGMTLLSARDLISSINGRISISKAGDKRSSIVRLPMAKQLELIGGV